jgi:hypothetical protein
MHTGIQLFREGAAGVAERGKGAGWSYEWKIRHFLSICAPRSFKTLTFVLKPTELVIFEQFVHHRKIWDQLKLVVF